MRFMDKLKSIQDRVLHLLKNHPKLRESDSKLVANYWYYELLTKGIPLESITSKELLQMFADKKLSSFESISRCRRKLQEKYPELQGVNHELKQEEAKDVKQNIRDVFQ